MTSWTQQAFQLKGCLALQLTATAFIFAQIYLSLVGTIAGSSFCAVILGFQLVRLLQFLFKTLLGLQMAQSNMACVCLAVIGATSAGSSITVMLSVGLLCLDALLGSVIFYAVHHRAIHQQLALVHRVTTFTRLTKAGSLQIEFIDNEFARA